MLLARRMLGFPLLDETGLCFLIHGSGVSAIFSHLVHGVLEQLT